MFAHKVRQPIGDGVLSVTETCASAAAARVKRAFTEITLEPPRPPSPLRPSPDPFGRGASGAIGAASARPSLGAAAKNDFHARLVGWIG